MHGPRWRPAESAQSAHAEVREERRERRAAEAALAEARSEIESRSAALEDANVAASAAKARDRRASFFAEPTPRASWLNSGGSVATSRKCT